MVLWTSRRVVRLSFTASFLTLSSDMLISIDRDSSLLSHVSILDHIANLGFISLRYVILFVCGEYFLIRVVDE